MNWVFPKDKSSIVQGPCKQKSKCGLSFMDGGQWDVVGSCLGEETDCPELFHSMIISVKAKKT